MNAQHLDFNLTMVYLADSLVEDFDVLDLADRMVRAATTLIGAAEAGMMLDDQRGRLRVLLASTEETRLLELLELETEEGPCPEAFATGNIVEVPRLADRADQWPSFVESATALGFTAAYPLPTRLRDSVIGAMNLFCTGGRALSSEEVQMGRALTSMATIGIINHRVLRRRELVAEQLQSALNSRVIIEQAKGVVAERAGVSMGEAFELLRAESRRSNRPLAELARGIATGELPAPTGGSAKGGSAKGSRPS